MRVLHVLSGDLWAGAEVATFHLLRALGERDDVSVRALLLNEGELAARLRAERIPVDVEPETEHGFRELVRAARRHARETDLVHAHRYQENLLAAFSGRPWVSTEHGRPEPYAGAAALRMAAYLRLDAFAKRHSARRVIAVSREIEAWLGPRVGAERTVRVWNGIADPAPAAQPARWAERPRRVGAVGRLFPVKNLALAVDAVAACPGLELEIVGDGPERAALERRAQASGAAERIRFCGFEADPLPRVARWRALLLPSLHEGNPISVLEALSVGTPVLAADLPGVSEILEGRGGWIEPTRQAERWAEQLVRIVDGVEEGEVASRDARARFEADFTAARCAERTVAVYRGAIGA